MPLNVDLRGSHGVSDRAFGEALVNGIGTAEYVKECREEFYNRMAMITRVRDPESSRHNLEALRNGKLNFIITGDNND